MNININGEYVNASLIKSVIKSMSITKITNKINKNPKDKQLHVDNMISFILSLEETPEAPKLNSWDYRVIVESFDRFGTLTDEQYKTLTEGLFFKDYSLNRLCDIVKGIMDYGCRWTAYRAKYGLNIKQSKKDTVPCTFKLLDSLKEVGIEHKLLNEHNVKFFEPGVGFYFLRVYCELFGTSSWTFSYMKNDISERDFLDMLCAYMGIDIYNKRYERTELHRDYDSYAYDSLNKLRSIDSELFKNHFEKELEKYFLNVTSNFKIKRPRRSFFKVLLTVEKFANTSYTNIINNNKRIIIERLLLLPGRDIAAILNKQPELISYIEPLITNKAKRKAFKKELVMRELQ